MAVDRCGDGATIHRFTIGEASVMQVETDNRPSLLSADTGWLLTLEFGQSINGDVNVPVSDRPNRTIRVLAADPPFYPHLGVARGYPASSVAYHCNCFTGFLTGALTASNRLRSAAESRMVVSSIEGRAFVV